MSNTNTNEPESQLESSGQPDAAADGGYGFPTPEQELPDGVDSVETTHSSGDESLDDAADDADSDVALNEVPDDAATNPGSPDPTLAGDESDEAALRDDKSLGAPDRGFFQDEESGSDGEPGAGRLGGTDEQLHEELSSARPDGATDDPGTAEDASTPAGAPSSEAPISEENTSASERAPFSSESDADASGESL